MANKNIEININNGNGYDVLYPKTTLSNVTDWANTIYSKSQTYSRSETYSKSEVDNLLAGAGGKKLKFVTGSRIGRGIGSPSRGQEIFTIQTQNTDLVFWAIEYETKLYQQGFTYPASSSATSITYPTYEHWNMWFDLGNVSDNIFIATNSCTISLNVIKTSTSIKITYGNKIKGTDPSDWADTLMDYSGDTYTWIGIGVEN